MDGNLFALYGMSRGDSIGHVSAGQAASRAESKARGVEKQFRRLEDNLAKALMINEALWEIVRDQHGLTEKDLYKKLYEVERHERRTRRARRFLSLLLPGSRQVLRGRTARGLLLLGAWYALLICTLPDLPGVVATDGLSLASDLLLPPDAPVRFDSHPGRYLAALMLPLVWWVGNWRVWRAKEV